MKFDFVYLGQTVLKYEVPLEIFVGLNDIYATICDLVGIDIPHLSAQDSISFANYTYSENITDGLRQELATWNYLPLGMYGNLHVSLS